jgi:hypothetical protein
MKALTLEVPGKVVKMKKGVMAHEKEAKASQDKFFVLPCGEQGGLGRKYRWTACNPHLNIRELNGKKIVDECEIGTTKSQHPVALKTSVNSTTKDKLLLKLYFNEGKGGTNCYTFSEGIRQIQSGIRVQGETKVLGKGSEILVIMDKGSMITCNRTGLLGGCPENLVVGWDGENIHTVLS